MDKKYSLDDIGLALADALFNSKSINSDFPQELFPELDLKVLKKSLFALDLFCMSALVISTFGLNKIGLPILWSLNRNYKKLLLTSDYFNDANEYDEFMQPKLSQYEDAMKEEVSMQNLNSLANIYAESIGSENSSGIARMVEYVASSMEANLKLIQSYPYPDSN